MPPAFVTDLREVKENFSVQSRTCLSLGHRVFATLVHTILVAGAVPGQWPPKTPSGQFGGPRLRMCTLYADMAVV